MKAFKKASIALDKEYREAVETVYFATTLVLCREYGWKRLRIRRFLDKANDTCNECRESTQLSLVQMCDEKLGIEIRNDKNVSYKDTPYLNNDDWAKKKDVVMNRMTHQQQGCYLIRVRQKMKEWMFPQVLASVVLGLNSKEGWGVERLTRFTQQVQAVREEFDYDYKRIGAAVKEETGIEYKWTPTGSFALVLHDNETMDVLN